MIETLNILSKTVCKFLTDPVNSECARTEKGCKGLNITLGWLWLSSPRFFSTFNQYLKLKFEIILNELPKELWCLSRSPAMKYYQAQASLSLQS